MGKPRLPRAPGPKNTRDGPTTPTSPNLPEATIECALKHRSVSRYHPWGRGNIPGRPHGQKLLELQRRPPTLAEQTNTTPEHTQTKRDPAYPKQLDIIRPRISTMLIPLSQHRSSKPGPFSSRKRIRTTWKDNIKTKRLLARGNPDDPIPDRSEPATQPRASTKRPRTRRPIHTRRHTRAEPDIPRGYAGPTEGRGSQKRNNSDSISQIYTRHLHNKSVNIKPNSRGLSS